MLNLVIITGQTATGKTKLAYDLAKKHKGELINFDSRQIYKKLNIITGKEIFPDIKTHLIDIVDPKEQFSSFDFVALTKPLLQNLSKKGIVPILVGGSYLYIKHLLYGIDQQIPADWKLREKLNKKSVKELQSTLKNLNVRLFEQLNHSDINNPHRLIRKIELLSFAGGSRGGEPDSAQIMATMSSTDGEETRGRTRKIIGLRFKDDKSLRNSIEKRVEQRMRSGALQEVKHLIKQGYKITDPGMQTIGYKQLIQYLTGTISQDEALQQWITKEVQYAKRQYTFMKKDENIDWRVI
ncbi:MAG: tRNA (adenosine(37)-N6)-dimethylallyltransferase MiaA [Patescibacteria group bacterium]